MITRLSRAQHVIFTRDFERDIYITIYRRVYDDKTSTNNHPQHSLPWKGGSDRVERWKETTKTLIQHRFISPKRDRMIRGHSSPPAAPPVPFTFSPSVDSFYFFNSGNRCKGLEVDGPVIHLYISTSVNDFKVPLGHRSEMRFKK